MIAVNTAKVAATKVGLDMTNRIFEVMGARATSQEYGFDNEALLPAVRYWRNMRTFTLYDPVDYRLREIGKWALNDDFSQTGAYYSKLSSNLEQEPHPQPPPRKR
jgi:alkylation response protein AidB-like acyl-CoA dehydrogenase